MDQKALDTLHELVKHVFSDSSETIVGISYEKIAKRIGYTITKEGPNKGRGRWRHMGPILDKMGQSLKNLGDEKGTRIPYIQSLVVSGNLPSYGMAGFWPGYADLSAEEKRNKVCTEYLRIIDFRDSWNDVLIALGGKPVPIPSHISGKKIFCDNQQPYKGSYGAIIEESSQHLALKEYVSRHPELVGGNRSYDAFFEYAFPSLDTVDVLFKSPKQWIAVEVKSRVSDKLEKDYERGIYQCVKYRALLEAMQKDPRYDDVPAQVKAVLLLETNLPKQYKATATALSVKVIDKVSAPEK